MNKLLERDHVTFTQRVANNIEEAAALAIEGGTDMVLGCD
jgi:hypothetical protein